MTAAALDIDTLAYLGIDAAHRVAPRWRIEAVERAVLPVLDDLQRDWLASIAVPAFKILRAQRGAAAVRSFLSIGTGTGVDALAAIEVLGADVVGITDLFADVVAAAAENVRGNLRPSHPIALHAAAGDLVQPLQGRGLRFDVIYENLPNLPLADATQLEVQRTSAAFVPPRQEPVPGFVADWLLALHYLALVQSREFLAPRGTVLSTLGARLPLRIFADMAAAAGYTSRFLTYGWKAQADPAELIPAYAAFEQRGLGPFHFYPVEQLATVFGTLDAEQAGRDAFAIERDLTAGRLDAASAWDAFRRGVRIGHTVAVLQSALPATADPPAREH